MKIIGIKKQMYFYVFKEGVCLVIKEVKKINVKVS